MKNRMTLSDLDGMQIGAIAAMHVSDLAALMEDADDMVKKAKTYKDWLNGAVTIKYDERVKSGFKESAKDTGTIHILDDDFDVEVEVKKTVAWDSSALAKAFDAMSAAEAEHYCKCKLEVDERKFVAAPPAIKELLIPARTMKSGKPSFTIKRKEA